MDKKEQLQFYKNLHERESNRRDEIERAINGPIGLVAIVMGLIYFLSRNFEDSISLVTGDAYSIISGCLLSLAMLCFIACFVYMAKSYSNFTKGFDYKFLPYSLKLKSYQDELYSYKQGGSETSFEEYLLAKYVKYSDNNGQINKIRNDDLHSAKKYLLVSIFLLILTLKVVLIKNLLS